MDAEDRAYVEAEAQRVRLLLETILMTIAADVSKWTTTPPHPVEVFNLAAMVEDMGRGLDFEQPRLEREAQVLGNVVKLSWATEFQVQRLAAIRRILDRYSSVICDYVETTWPHDNATP